MDDELLRRLIPFVILLLLSAYFSGSEAAFFSLSALERDTLKRRSGSRLARILARILSSPDEILITLLTGNMFVNVFASALGDAIGARIFAFESEMFSIISMTVLLLIAGEMVPKNLAVRNTLSFSRISAIPLYYLFILLKPLRWFFNLFNLFTNRLFPLRRFPDQPSQHDIIRSAVQIGFKEGILDSSELHLVESFCDFREKQAEEVMVPRTEIRGVEVSTGIGELVSGAGRIDTNGGGSLLPAFEEDLDHLVGYIALRDLLPYKYGLKTGLRATELVKPSISVPSTKNCAELLVEMRESNTEMAVVIDEYGGTAGIVTFRGLIEQLLGYFYPSADRQVVEVAPDTFRIPGNLRIEELSLLLGRDITSESYTAAGLIIERLGEIPSVGRKMVINGLEFAVLQTSKNRILELEVKKL
jgi:putative hemolysin